MKRALSLVATALLAGACGSGDGEGADDGGPGGAARPGTAERAPDTTRFRSDRIAFTFEYPKDFAVRRKPGRGVLARVSVEPGAALNAIQVRRTAGRALGPHRYLEEFRRDFAKTVGVVEKRRARIGDLDMGILEFENRVERAGEPVEVSSALYFFTGAGQTWQIECVADAAHRARVEQACRGVLESVEFRGRR